MCQDLPRICQEPAGQRWHLHTFIAHTRPVIQTRSQTARAQNGGAAVTGLWPPSIKHKTCLQAQNALKINIKVRGWGAQARNA